MLLDVCDILSVPNLFSSLLLLLCKVRLKSRLRILEECSIRISRMRHVYKEFVLHDVLCVKVANELAHALVSVFTFDCLGVSSILDELLLSSERWGLKVLIDWVLLLVGFIEPEDVVHTEL